MKHSRLFLLALIVAISVFSAAVYTSCTKTAQCAAACLNGGSCSNGTCRCLSGFSGGRCQFSNIIYRNATYTYVMVTVFSKMNHDSVFVIPPSGSVQMPGTPGDTAMAFAYTYGPIGPKSIASSSTDIGPFGLTINLDTVFTPFPHNGNQYVDFHVDDRYFFLQIQNNNVGNQGSDNILSLVVNTLYSGQDIAGTQTPLSYSGNFAVVNDSLIHPVGYFGARLGSDVTTTDALGNSVNRYLNLVPSSDKGVIVTIP